jgi:hypothetical protein
VDGQLATNDPGGLSIWPGPDVLANGVFFGSDTNGNEQAQGLFNYIEAYDEPLGSNDVLGIFNNENFYVEDPYNTAMGTSIRAIVTIHQFRPCLNVITGSGYLQSESAALNCSYSTNGIWITNFVATLVSSNRTMNVTFSIDGGTNGAMYDVFATGAFQIPIATATWAWMGQGPSCYRYTITGISNNEAIFILGTPQDTSNAELTDAYQLLVSKTNPNVQDSDLDGLITGWEILLGLNPHISNIANSAQRVNYTYTPADWINGVSGIKGNSSVGMDNEGNVLTVSQ